MLNLNTYGDIALDYRYYEDPSDEFKVTDDSVEGSLLPLWSFKLEEIGNMEVTGLCWNKKYSDLLGNVSVLQTSLVIMLLSRSELRLI